MQIFGLTLSLSIICYWPTKKREKANGSEVAEFALNLEAELLSLQHELAGGIYLPGEYRQFNLYERKPRLISAAPFRDRVAHHALMNVVEPLLDKSYIFDSYACRKGKGVHLAVSRYQHWAKRYSYALKLDIASYFPSIDRDILKAQLRRQLKDRSALNLFDTILDHAPQPLNKPIRYFAGDDLLTPLERPTGLPIGNLTSQVLANLYLNDLDHFIKEKLRVKAYLRYVDDLILLDDDKAFLWACRDAIAAELEKLRLILHPAKINLFQTRLGVDVLGYRIFPRCRLFRNDNGYRFARKLKRFAAGYACGRLDWEDFNRSVQSWIGHASHADTFQLREKLFFCSKL